MVENVASDIPITEAFVECFGVHVEVTDALIATLAVFEVGRLDSQTV